MSKRGFKGWTADAAQKAAKPAQAAKHKRRKQNPEYEMQAAFVRAMSVKYPNLMVYSDTAAHIGKSLLQQMRANRLSSVGEKWPDVFIAQMCGGFGGMYIEFKAESPYKKDGVTLLKNPHIEAQAETMKRLRERGYYVPDFVWSLETAMKEVDWYLNLGNRNTNLN
jgi:hypothetical protein